MEVMHLVPLFSLMEGRINVCNLARAASTSLRFKASTTRSSASTQPHDMLGSAACKTHRSAKRTVRAAG
jgi:hypothetical protein